MIKHNDGYITDLSIQLHCCCVVPVYIQQCPLPVPDLIVAIAVSPGIVAVFTVIQKGGACSVLFAEDESKFPKCDL